MKTVQLIVTLEFSEEFDSNFGTAEVARNVINALENAVNTSGLAPEHTETMYPYGEDGAYTTSISVISPSDDSFEYVREF